MTNLKFGRRSPKNARHLKLKSFLKAIPDHPISEDYLSQLSDWQMLGNDQYGVCAAVTWANMRRFYSTLLGGNENYPDINQVFEIYKTQNPNFPNQDDGMDVQTLLEYLVKNAGPDGVKALAFASVDYTNLDEIKAALAIFGGIFLGVNVQNANMDDFNSGKPWNYHSGNQIDGGHAILAGGYLGQTKNDVRFITWGQETSFTDNFWTHLVEEAWVVIWPEILGTKQFMDSINLQVLSDDYKAMTGSDFPVVVSPVPSPDPYTPIPGGGGFDPINPPEPDPIGPIHHQ